MNGPWGRRSNTRFPMSMGVRAGDEALKKRLDDVIENHQAELTAILTENGVMSYAPRQQERPR